MTQWYVLNEMKRPVPVDGCNPERIYLNWADNNPNLATVRRTYVGNVSIATVFIGQDVGAGSSIGVYKPVVFKSKVLGGFLDGEERYYTDWSQAEAGHESLINAVNASRFTVSNCLKWMKKRGSQIWKWISSAWLSWSRW